MNRNLEFASFPMPPFFRGREFSPEWVQPDAEGSSRAESGKSVKIIVIDDEALIAETVVEILKQEGFDATFVSSGASAIELAKTLRPAIVLSDVIMPGMNGVETGIKIREIVPDCSIILFSGQAATVDLLEQARERGHRFDILAKPIKPEHLIGIIRSKLAS